MGTIFRFSRDSDYKAVRKLFKLCFGDSTPLSSFLNLDGRYLLAFIDNKLVSITGVNESLDFIGAYEVDYTCTHPDYRGYDLVTTMIRKLLVGVNADVYCICWGTPSSSLRCNLLGVMMALDFKLVEKDYQRYHLKGESSCMSARCNCNNCPDYIGVSCSCWCDLYLLSSVTNLS